MSDYIPLSVPSFNGKEWEYVKECLDTEWVSSAGKYVDLFEQKIVEYTGAKHAVACVNGTSALQVSLRLAGVMAGDEVIVPTLTFISPVNAVRYNGAEPIFMDADDYYNIDSEKTIQFIKNESFFKDGFTFNKKTNRKITAIIPVHVFGNAVWMDELFQLCVERNISIVEDAAESFGTRYINGSHSGKHTGTVGLLGCLSFNGNKIITTGGGGIILTNDADLAKKANYLTRQAKDESIRFIHNEIGYNFRLTNIQAALGVAQLEQLESFLEIKKKTYQKYKKVINGITGLQIVEVPDYANNNYWMMSIQIDKDSYGKDRDQLITHLSNNNIETRPVWHLNHLQKPYENCTPYNIRKAEDLLSKTVCIPSSVNITEDQINSVIGALVNA